MAHHRPVAGLEIKDGEGGTRRSGDQGWWSPGGGLGLKSPEADDIL